VSVRYGEVDQQGVVFNAHYLAYIDDTLENWLRPVRQLGSQLAWDMMLRKCTIEWYGSAGSGDLLDIDVAVARWGRTSWDLGYVGACAGSLVFSALVAYVSVDLQNRASVETPREIRAFMGEAVDLVAARS